MLAGADAFGPEDPVVNGRVEGSLGRVGDVRDEGEGGGRDPRWIVQRGFLAGLERRCDCQGGGEDEGKHFR